MGKVIGYIPEPVPAKKNQKAKDAKGEQTAEQGKEDTGDKQ